MNYLKKILILLISLIVLSGCKNGKLPGADARKVPYSAQERVKRNIESGKGFRLTNLTKNKGGGNFEFASSNELWRASLDAIDFMPLASANYSGGMIITDWYANDQDPQKSIKLTIRFLTNEIRSDALNIKIFHRNCEEINRCVVNEKGGELAKELKIKILKTAAEYKLLRGEEEFEEYIPSNARRN